MVCWSWLDMVIAGLGWSHKPINQQVHKTHLKPKNRPCRESSQDFRLFPPKKIIFYIPLNTCSPTHTNCTGIKHSLTPWCGGEECSSRGLTVAVWELGPVFEVQDTRGNGAVLALLRVGGHRG